MISISSIRSKKKLICAVFIYILLFSVGSCKQVPIVTSPSSGSLEITHTPLSLKDVPKELIEHLNYAYVRFYRTDVKNSTDRPIKIVWFDAYSKFDGQWIAANIRNKVLRTKDFIDWHTTDHMTPDGWLRPGGTASCLVNWHASETPEDTLTKWAYIGVDAQGNDYFAEAIVPDIKPEKMKPAPSIKPPDEQGAGSHPG
jgi:hypothetical protein